MGIRLAVTAAFTIAAASFMTTTTAARSSASARQTRPLDNDTLLEAYRQSISDASHGRYLDASSGLLKRLGVEQPGQINDPDVIDQWAQVMSCMTGMPTFNPAKTADFHVPAGQIADLRAAAAVSAIPEIVRRAKRTSIVILDENHLDPRGRAFGLEVARALRPLGYTVLAAEALKRDADDAASRDRMAKLARDGYARQSSGYYLDDPVFADFLRRSLALGYRPVSYETARTKYADDPAQAQGQREQDQADGVVRRALRQYPGAKILIYVGEHHVAERPIAAEGGKVAMMAERLKRATGIDPLTIDQAGLSSMPMNRPGAELYALAAPKARERSVVLMRHGEPLTVGLLAGSVDLQVVHPRTVEIDGRPAWLEIMHRKPAPIPRDLLPKSGTRLVQAFLASEAEDAIPLDQVLVEAGRTPPTMMLSRKPVRYVVQTLPWKPADDLSRKRSEWGTCVGRTPTRFPSVTGHWTSYPMSCDMDGKGRRHEPPGDDMLALMIVLASPPSAGIAELSWMAGHWLECTARGEAAETWTDGRGQVMLGLSKTVRGDRTGWELSRIGMTPQGVTFFASPKGQPPAAFKAVTITRNKVVFENPDHDFPQRVIYLREGNRLTGRIEGNIGGKARSAEWHYQPAALNSVCPARSR